jgi:hypothetical protein
MTLSGIEAWILGATRVWTVSAEEPWWPTIMAVYSEFVLAGTEVTAGADIMWVGVGAISAM